jgi:hypothetical protein
MALSENFFPQRKNQAKEEIPASKINLRKILQSVDFQKNPPVIKITPSETKVGNRHAIIRPEGDIKKIKKGFPLCFYFYDEINSQFPVPCGGCGLSLESLEKGKIESSGGKVVALIEFVGFAMDQKHCQKKWSSVLQ